MSNLLSVKRILVALGACLALVGAPAHASTQSGSERLEYASALQHTLRNPDGVLARTTTLIAMRNDGVGWIRMRMCTSGECEEIFDTLSPSEYWRGSDPQTIEFYLQADIEGLGWTDVAIGNLADPGGMYHSIDRVNGTAMVGLAESGGWVTDAVNHSSSIWGDWTPAGSGQSFNAYRAHVAWVWP